MLIVDKARTLSAMETRALRLLLNALTIGVFLGAGVLYLLSLDSAALFPEYAHLRVPTYLGVVVGFVPVLVGIGLLFRFLRLVDAGEAFSGPTLRVIRQVKLLIAGVATYYMVGLGAFQLAFGQGQPGVLLAWLGLEVALLLLLAGFALLERLIRIAHALREDVEMTV
ncbi:MAG: DUF2975 domain-containing protein [Proteobacteria bacterium]|nr:DUF2975 domain-containing protein [Pseudomonadota bacterium]